MAPEENLVDTVDTDLPEWLAQLEGLLETLNEGVIVTDDCHRIVWVNSCFEEMIWPFRLRHGRSNRIAVLHPR